MDDQETTEGRKRGEAPEVPVGAAVKRAKAELQRAFCLLHHAQGLNGLSPEQRFHSLGDLEAIKATYASIGPAIRRIEELLIPKE